MVLLAEEEQLYPFPNFLFFKNVIACLSTENEDAVSVASSLGLINGISILNLLAYKINFCCQKKKLIYLLIYFA